MRESDWQIRWNPLSDAPAVLLDFDDVMEGEIARSMTSAVDASRLDFAASAQVVARGNVKRRLEFGRRIEHDTNAESWEACSAAVLAGPWAKGVISVRDRYGNDRLLRAALLSSSHEPQSGGALPASFHGYAFRVTPINLVASGGITIIGGWYNPPTGGVGGTPGGPSIVITVPGGSGLNPGDTVYIPGGVIPGVIPGYYPVGGVSSGGGQDHVTVDAPHDKEPFEGSEDALIVFNNDLPTSPFSGNYFASIKGSVQITTEVPIEVYAEVTPGSGFDWRAYGAGVHSISSQRFHNPGIALGTWAGLSHDSPSREVSYGTVSAVMKWRRVGVGGEHQVVVPLEGKGQVNYFLGDEHTEETTRPPVTLHVTAFGYAGGVVGTFEGGGEINKMTEP